MYIKLALRNFKRSTFDYLMYIITMTILSAIMHLSNCIAILGDIQEGFQTASLPLLIVIIMVVLVNYINTFMIKLRAKEFANYLLLGMEKGKLSQMFLIEFCFIGIICFVFGGLLGSGAYLVILFNTFRGPKLQQLFMIKSILHTLIYLVIVEGLSAVRIRKKMYGLQISELMIENRRNQSLREDRKTFWLIGCTISFLILFVLLCSVTFLSEKSTYAIIPFISIPLLCCIVAFYKWLYAYFSSKRLKLSEHLYQGNRIYRIAEMTTGTKTDVLLNSVFSICLLFAIMAYVNGALLLNESVVINNPVKQHWMGFLQISISIIFMTIYFSILSLQLIIGLKRQAKSILILHYMGKSLAQIKFLLKTQVMLKLLVPTLMCFVLLLICTPLVNYKINMILPDIAHNSIIKSVGWFIICFSILYLCYFLIICIISKRYLKLLLTYRY
ncbi:FtsX-like permease family protein [Anaerocolumna sp. MB42-C2]|uniref:FtsX-like permease family protein n=1 Tax=Anaerocolumna sp. MB42-C2 TaxID=3070997 RepID=UPI0027E20A62|nr:FtsX-like permease family protein [Anaerocolumna sp. MB42-C2]WMJ88331.1 FtsX-like permease family protein [Anaerocolumna sp. MB42-C2]